eukprot:4825925-Pleurochrysis_carterae.AAC.2
MAKCHREDSTAQRTRLILHSASLQRRRLGHMGQGGSAELRGGWRRAPAWVACTVSAGQQEVLSTAGLLMRRIIDLLPCEAPAMHTRKRGQMRFGERVCDGWKTADGGCFLRV